MTASLEKAFAKAACLSEAAQEQLAEQVLDDIAGERKWDQALAKSQGLLERLSKQARASRRRGKTLKKGFDEL
jgi:hypothetical protein